MLKQQAPILTGEWAYGAEEQAQQGLSAQLCYLLSVHECPQQWWKGRGEEKKQEEEDINETNGSQPWRVRILFTSYHKNMRCGQEKSYLADCTW